VTKEDDAVALFARANPVPSLELLDPVEPLAMDRLGPRTERSSDMAGVRTMEPSRLKWRQRPIWAVAAATIAVVIAIPLMVNRDHLVGDADRPPEEVAVAFMEAIAEHDGGAALELFASDGRFDGSEPSDAVGFFDLDGAIGMDYTNRGCEERPTGFNGALFFCDFVVENEWTRALGLEAASGEFMILVEDGQIRNLAEFIDNPRALDQAFETFDAWLEENHGGAIATMRDESGGVSFEPDSIALWEQYTDEFVAQVEN
jgi:hypothetical protein